VSDTLRREQMALAIATLTSRRAPSPSRCVTVFGPVLWIAWRAGIAVTIVDQGEEAGPAGAGYVQFRLGNAVQPPLPFPRQPEEVSADDFLRWIAVPGYIVGALWELMRPEDNTELGSRLRETVRELSDTAPKEDQS